MKNNYFQGIGAVSLVLAGMCGLANELYIAWYLLGVTGIITLTCAIQNKWTPTRTVSQWIQDITSNKIVDYFIGGGIIAVAAIQYFSLYGFERGMEYAFWPLIIGLAIHFFANKD